MPERLRPPWPGKRLNGHSAAKCRSRPPALPKAGRERAARRVYRAAARAVSRRQAKEANSAPVLHAGCRPSRPRAAHRFCFGYAAPRAARSGRPREIRALPRAWQGRTDPRISPPLRRKPEDASRRSPEASARQALPPGPSSGHDAGAPTFSAGQVRLKALDPVKPVTAIVSSFAKRLPGSNVVATGRRISLDIRTSLAARAQGPASGSGR